jgi:hypothetical protein
MNNERPAVTLITAASAIACRISCVLWAPSPCLDTEGSVVRALWDPSMILLHQSASRFRNWYLVHFGESPRVV